MRLFFIYFHLDLAIRVHSIDSFVDVICSRHSHLHLTEWRANWFFFCSRFVCFEPTKSNLIIRWRIFYLSWMSNRICEHSSKSVLFEMLGKLLRVTENYKSLPLETRARGPIMSSLHVAYRCGHGVFVCVNVFLLPFLLLHRHRLSSGIREFETLR